MFCPRCHTEFTPETRTCPKCRERLVSSLPPDPRQAELFETAEVCKVPDEVTGMAIQSFLLENGLDAVLRDLSVSFYSTVMVGVQGFWGSIVVPKQEEEQAKKLYRDFCRAFQGK